MDKDTTFQIAMVVAATLVAISAIFALVIWQLGKIAFNAAASSEMPSKVFGLFFDRAPAITTIVFIVGATVALAFARILEPALTASILSSIAGFVLGTERKAADDRVSTDKHSRTPAGPQGSARPNTPSGT